MACTQALVRVLHAQRKYLATAKTYDQVIALQDPALSEHFLSGADALVDAGGPHLDETLAGIEKGMIELGLSIVLQRVAIDINLRQGDRVVVLNRIEKKSIDGKESWLLQKAEILLEMGRYKNAQEQLVLAQSTIDSSPHCIRNSAAMIELHSSIKKLMNPKIQYTGTKQ